MRDVSNTNPHPRLPANRSGGITYYNLHRHSSFRPLRPLLIGVGGTVILTFIEVVLFLLLLGGNIGQRVSALLAFVVHSPLIWLVALFEFAGIFLIVVSLMRPLALRAYRRVVQGSHERYRKEQTALDAVTNIYETSVTYYEASATRIGGDDEGRLLPLPTLVQQQDAHVLLLGEAGAGKTTVLRLYEARALQQSGSSAGGRALLPVYIPMSHYNLFLNTYEAAETAETARPTLLDFLYESDLPGIHTLQPYLKSLAEQGRLLLLCDDLDEVDSQNLTVICQELVQWMLGTQNSIVLTCREGAYRERPTLVALVQDGRVARAELVPLYHEQVREFVEHFLKAQNGQRQHTAGQILQVINQSRLRYSSTNVLLLSMLLEIIDQVGIVRARHQDTRSRLVRAWVAQVIENEQQHPKWNKAVPAKSDVVRLLSRVACAARWAGERDAIQLPVSRSLARQEKHLEHGEVRLAVADAMQAWLNEHAAQGPFVLDGGRQTSIVDVSYDREQLGSLLQFAQSAGFIEISPKAVLSFRHELIASYFVAEYFLLSETSGAAARGVARQTVPLSLQGQLLADAEYWSESVALWAGLLDNPMMLAERFALVGRSDPTYVLSALVLSLLCVGVLWAPPTPPQADTQVPVVVPSSIEETLTPVLQEATRREELADLFLHCVQAGGQEVYHSLLGLLMVNGIDEFLLLLDTTVVSGLLFGYLYEAVDVHAYDAQVKRLVRILGHFGALIVPRATELSRPAAGRSVRLRAAAINILGGTQDRHTVEPLIARLGDAEPFIVERAVNGLIRLGPELTLPNVLAELENRKATPFTRQIHQATLLILARFLIDAENKYQLTSAQQKRILETLLPVLSSQYAQEPEVQQKVQEILLQRGQEVVEALVGALVSQDEMLVRNVVQLVQQIGSAALPYLLEQMDSHPSEAVRVRIVEVLAIMRVPEVLPALLSLLADPSLLVQQAVANALRAYSPESIRGLIDLVLHSSSEPVASRAAQILGDLGKAVVVPVMDVLLDVVPGRTRLLVHVLERGQDPQAISALIALLRVAGIEPLLTVAVVRALSKFRDKRVVPPLLNVLADANSQLYEEAIDALSHLGEVALEGIVAALDVEQETSTTLRLHRVLLGMTPFPGTQLIDVLPRCTDAQIQQIMLVFQKQGAEAAQILVAHLFHADLRVRGYIRQTLSKMEGRVVVPALLEVLNRPAWLPVLSDSLLKYPEAIPLLVGLLGDRERDDAAATILQRFGPVIFPSLVSALDDQGSIAQEHAQRIMVSLVRQSPQTLIQVVQLFGLSLPPHAYEAVLAVLTDDLADQSTSALLAGLEDAHLVGGVSTALVRLVRKSEIHGQEAMKGLLDALWVEERRRNAEAVLVEIGAPAVPPVGNLITESNPQVATAAKRILRDIGVPAFSFIWAAHSDRSNRARREAALEVFHNMPTSVIIDELVERLTSDKAEDISMALALLLERVHDETTAPTAPTAPQTHGNQAMIPALLEHVQAHGEERASLRLLALLLLLGGPAVIQQMVQALHIYPQHHQRLAHAFLLLGAEAKEALQAISRDAHTPVELRAEMVGVLAMIAPLPEVSNAARTLAEYGLTSNHAGLLDAEKLAISLRALGGLLVAGHWDIPMLQELRSTSKEESAEHELYDILLGWRYGPRLSLLEDDLLDERQARGVEQKEFRRELLLLKQQLMSEQQRTTELERELEEVHREHDEHKDLLHQTTREKEELTRTQQALLQENNQLKQGKLAWTQERQKLVQANAALTQEKQALTEQVTQGELRSEQMLKEMRRLRGLQG